MHLFLKILKWSAITIAVAFAALVVYRMFVLRDKEKTDEQVAKIHATRLTLDDVMGKNLPPDPGEEADKTIQGIDANRNGVRDDVELAIFRLHPDSARIRAAELQYAMALQMELTDYVFNSETLIAVANKEAYGSGCIGQTAPKINPEDSPEKMNKIFAISDARIKEVKNLILNTEVRKKSSAELFKKYMTSFGIKNRVDDCDISLASLPD